MPDLDDVRGVSMATIHAATTAAMILGVPLLIGRRIAGGRRLAALTTATMVAAGFTIATQRTAWGLVRLWLKMDDRSTAR
jgi:hypothetical protein